MKAVIHVKEGVNVTEEYALEVSIHIKEGVHVKGGVNVKE